MININYQGDLAPRKLDSLRDFVMINTSSIAKRFLLHPYALMLSERRKKSQAGPQENSYWSLII